MNKKDIMKGINIILIIIAIILTYFQFKTISHTKPPHQNIVDNNVGADTLNNTGAITSGDTIGVHSLDILQNFQVDSKDIYISDYPLIQINSEVHNVKLIVNVTFTDRFIKYYSYKDSASYFFALKFFLGEITNGGFFNVFRNSNNGVSNDLDLGLNGARNANSILRGETREIPLEKTVIAQDPGEYGYKYFRGEKYLNDNVGSAIPIGFYLTPTKEVNGRNLTRIEKVSIEYEGEEDAITLFNK